MRYLCFTGALLKLYLREPGAAVAAAHLTRERLKERERARETPAYQVKHVSSE